MVWTRFQTYSRWFYIILYTRQNHFMMGYTYLHKTLTRLSNEIAFSKTLKLVTCYKMTSLKISWSRN